ncbi:MAG: Asp-tRNA(Asn)/Glu-tRNA(Gln) amidotransferase subunit GatA [Puniceicoccales bacterium]|jgi:aspartyl-tRNA(Asn)/glutamyl-tRNA(Gln) amidotransferase subunit A|nr:Asp-tRNA(Asn)/Glu-tRNA(Gln) amidotransferase subunit GatA [Puniceicoccales bacterium]
MAEEFFYKSISALSDMLRRRIVSSEELTRVFIDRTKSLDGSIGAFLSYDEEKTLNQARESDKRRSNGLILSDLDGIPVGIKDAISEEGQPLTCASRILEHYISPYDATVIRRLKDCGAVLWGRLNMDEFAMGASTENSAFKITHNPWNLDCVPGGSGGGSAAAVCAGEVPVALGSDTGGSVRQPASLCGIVGLKPSYGLVSRYGLAALASSTDQIGPTGRSIRDVAILLQAIAGHDARDSTSYRVDVPDYVKYLEMENFPKTIGLPKEYFADGLDDEVREAVHRAVDFYGKNGFKIKEISLPHTKYAVPVYYIIMTTEASSNLARFDGVRYTRRSKNTTNAVDIYFRSREEGFGAEAKRRILLGTYVLSRSHHNAYYIKAQKVRTKIREDFLKAFNEVDIILSPTSPCTAFRIGEKLDDPLSMYLADIYTVSASLAGLPAISIPCGFSSKKLPIGLQLMARPFHETDIMMAAKQFEDNHDFVNRVPNIGI